MNLPTKLKEQFEDKSTELHNRAMAIGLTGKKRDKWLEKRMKSWLTKNMDSFTMEMKGDKNGL